ncbi:MAG TPA: DUF3226 domain-containing protein [Pirellulales bacterium]|nr:DUF3226 domain-containing protein [Pirellulales bacterium]
MSTPIPLPTLYVEGKDDISVVNALLSRHGVDTGRGKRHLRIEDHDNVETLLLGMPVAVKAATDRPVGFVVDIDVEIKNRWDAVRGRLREAGVGSPPSACPATGYFGQFPDYAHRFGVWLMPDCAARSAILPLPGAARPSR